MLTDGTLRHRDAHWSQFGGGVSSDVYLVRDRERIFVVKQVLAKLRVRDDWHADTSRIHSEIEYLRWVGQRLPEAVPRLLATGDGYFTMEFLDTSYRNWKTMMLAGQFDARIAARAGTILGGIHRMSFHSPEVERLFPHHHLFHQLRIEPYLLTTAARTPALRALIEAEARRLGETHECLMHGDYSPKNMLAAPDRLVVLDCETANYGDPAFDLAFLLTHLLLKGLYHSPAVAPALRCAQAAVAAYFSALTAQPERRAELDGRTARLLQIILLARVDGKSPAEYLTPEHAQFLREFIHRSLTEQLQLNEVIDRWFQAAGSLKEIV
jgi:aminoglycoside phosphotransferase (APT) family kinase protein